MKFVRKLSAGLAVAAATVMAPVGSRKQTARPPERQRRSPRPRAGVGSTSASTRDTSGRRQLTNSLPPTGYLGLRVSITTHRSSAAISAFSISSAVRPGHRGQPDARTRMTMARRRLLSRPGRSRAESASTTYYHWSAAWLRHGQMDALPHGRLCQRATISTRSVTTGTPDHELEAGRRIERLVHRCGRRHGPVARLDGRSRLSPL